MTTIRLATERDADLIVGLVRALAAFEKAGPDEVKVTPEQIRRHGFGPRPVFECLVAEHDGTAVGFALFFHNFSTWEGQPGIYLEDLFVLESHRQLGIGRDLLAAIARLAVERGCPRVDWAVLDWNPARGFYEKIGARHMKEWLIYRLAGDALARVAAGQMGSNDA